MRSTFQILFALVMGMTFFPLQGEVIQPDSSLSTFSQNSQQVLTYDFEGTYPELEKISLNEVKGRPIELHLTGNYPLLHLVEVKSTSGNVELTLLGELPALQSVHLETTSGNVTLRLPKAVNVNVFTKVSSGEVRNQASLKEEGGFLQSARKKRAFSHRDFQDGPLITVYVQTTSGNITFQN